LNSCPPIATLRRHLDDEVNPHDSTEIVAHLDQCPDCLQRLAEMAREHDLPLGMSGAPSWQGEETEEVIAHLARIITCPELSTSQEAGNDPPPLPEIPGFGQLELVGRGGSGDVYRAWQIAESRWVALKILNPTRSLGRADRIRREARILGRLNHPHIVRIHDTGEQAGQPFLVVEWITGGSLRDRLQRGPLPIRQAVELARQVASALETVHALGIVHRDLKPANVLLEPGPTAADAPCAKLTDFSIAWDSGTGEHLTSTGLVLGTPQYMAPEQTGLSHSGMVGPTTDIYGVGALLYTSLTGIPPHPGESTLATLSQVASVEPVPPRRLRAEIPPDLETIIVKCLRNNPAHRYRTAGELAEDLQRFLQGRPITARPYTPTERLWRWGRGHPVAATTAAMAGLLLLTSLAGVMFHLRSNQALIQQLAEQKQAAEVQAYKSSQLAEEAQESRSHAVRQALLASRSLLWGESLTPEIRRQLVQQIRENPLRELQAPNRMSPSQAEALAGSLMNLIYIEQRESMFDLHREDCAHILSLSRQFPGSAILRRLAALSQVDRHRLQIRDHQFEEAEQTLATLFSLGELEPNEQAACLQALREHAFRQEESQLPQQARRTLDWACRLAQKHLNRDPGDHHRWRILLDLSFLRAELINRTAAASSGNRAFDDWKKSLDTLRQSPHPNTLDDSAARCLVLLTQVDRALSCQQLDLARSLFGNVREELAAAQAIDPLSPQTVQLRLDRAGLLLQLSKSVPLTPEEQTDWQQGLESARQYLRDFPGQPDVVRNLARNLLYTTHYHLAKAEPVRAEASAREALTLLTSVSRRPLPFPEILPMLSDAHFFTFQALLGTPRVTERRFHLESAYRFADNQKKPSLARDLVLLHLEAGDLAAAEQACGWIPPDNDELREARKRIDEARQRNAASTN